MHLKHLKLKSFIINVFIPFAIIMVIIFAYSDVRHNQFLNFDDNDCVTENIHVQNGFSIEGL